MDIEELSKIIRRFRDDRDWAQFHNPKKLAISVSVEADELLERFQWKTGAESSELTPEERGRVSHKIADVAIYLIGLRDALGVDLDRAIRERLEANAVKYPGDKVKGAAAKYDEL